VAVQDAGRPASAPEVAGPPPAPPTAEVDEDVPAVSVRARLGILGNRRLLGTLIAGGLMMTVLVTVASSEAYFTASSTSPDVEFEADEVDIGVAHTGQLIDGSGLRPGDARSGTQTITSYGHRVRLTLAATGLSGGPLLDVLVVTVEETSPGSAERYRGPLRDLRDADLGMLQAAGVASFRVTVTWPANRTEPPLYGTSVAFDFEWSAVSVS
jgi:hypothetical protein